MATKAELADAYARYRLACVAATQAEAIRDFRAAVGAAEAALPLVYPAAAYRRRYLKVEPAAPTLACVLRYAPPLFLGPSLDAVERWFATGTRTERADLPDLPQQVAAARVRLASAASLWERLAADPAARLWDAELHPEAVDTVRVWQAVGAVDTDGRTGRLGYARASDARRPAEGKCAGCGVTLAAPLARLLDPLPCPACDRTCQFIVVRRID